MKIHFVAAAVLATLAAATATGESLAGKLGVTGHLGFLIPAASSDTSSVSQERLETRTSFIGGGGFIYGIGDHFAVELEASHAIVDVGNREETSFERTAIDVGFQYRFRPERKLVPFIGAGAEILFVAFREDESKYSVDPALAGYLKAGLDYFIVTNVALTAEFKQVLGTDAEISAQGISEGKFNPRGSNGFFGVRLIF